MRHFLTLKDFTKDEILEIITLSIQLKKELKAKMYKNYLANQTLGMIFEKNSTRTRVSFETGIYQLGGIGLFLDSNSLQIGRGEPLKDTSRVISSMVDMIMIRNNSQKDLEEFAKFSKVPVINALTNMFHPMQLLADYLTIVESNLEDNLKVAYIGDGNNMTNSWLILAAKLGFELRIATPKGYEVDNHILQDAYEIAKESGSKIMITHDPKIAIQNATVVTTDTWISMGQEEEKNIRLRAFEKYQVNDTLMQYAHDNAIFLHCLPAYRGYEVSEDLFESHSTTIFTEAENRLHVQKAVMVWLDRKRES